MALSQSALLEVLDALKASDSTDVIRHALQVMLQQLIDAEATAFIGAEPHQRTDARTNLRNGTRSKTITTAAGDLDLSITKLRQGTFFPSPVGATPPHRPGVVRGDHGGLRHRHQRAQGRQPGPGPGRRHRHLQVRGVADLRRPRRAGRRLRRPHPGRDRRSPTCSSTPPTARPGSAAPATARAPGWSPRRSWSPPVSPPTGVVRSSGSPSVTPRTAPSGPRSCARSRPAG